MSSNDPSSDRSELLKVENAAKFSNAEYLNQMNNTMASIRSVIQMLDTQNTLLTEYARNFEENLDSVTHEYIKQAMEEPLVMMYSVLESERAWFETKDNQLRAVVLDENMPMSSEQYDWTNYTGKTFPEVEELPIEESDDERLVAMKLLTTIINNTSHTIRDMRVLEETLQKRRSGVKWAFEQNSFFMFDVDDMIRETVSEITERLQEECTFLAQITSKVSQMKSTEKSNDGKERVQRRPLQTSTRGGFGLHRRGSRGAAYAGQRVAQKIKQQVDAARTPLIQSEPRKDVPLEDRKRKMSVEHQDLSGLEQGVQQEVIVETSSPEGPKIAKVEDVTIDELGQPSYDPMEISFLSDCMKVRLIHLFRYLKSGNTSYKAMNEVLFAAKRYLVTEVETTDSTKWREFIVERKLVAERNRDSQDVIALYGAFHALQHSDYADGIKQHLLYLKSQVVQNKKFGSIEPVGAETEYALDVDIWFKSTVLASLSQFLQEHPNKKLVKDGGNLDTLPFVKSRIEFYKEKSSCGLHSTAMFIMYGMVGERQKHECFVEFFNELQTHSENMNVKEREFFATVFGLDSETLAGFQ